MRDIKFRIWNPSGNNMLYDIDNVFECLKQQIKFDKTMPDRGFVTPYDHRSEGMVWEQFTGLRDKKGVDIYEGDILKYESRHPKHEGKFFNNLVEFASGQTLVGWRMRNKSAIVRATPFKFMDSEIIGNIHTNPELLNPSNK